MTNHRLKLEQLLTDTIVGLPPLETTVAEMAEAYRVSRDDTARLAEIAGRDSALAAELMHLANSPCFVHGKPRQPSHCLASAVTRLGADTVMAFVASRSTRHMLCPTRITDTRWREYLDHSQQISLSCRVLAAELGLAEPEQRAYDAVGLLHDVGRMVMIASDCCEDMPLLGTDPDQMISILEHEEDAMGMNHCIVAERLFRRWHFPEFLCDAVMRHHTPFVGDDFSFAGAVIFTAHFVAMSDITGRILQLAVKPALLEALGTDLGTIERAQAKYQEVQRSAN